MPRELKLPDVGEGIAEGEIVSWHVEPGDSVEEDQVLAEVETDKAVVDIPSPVSGTVLELHAEPGDIVEVGSVIVTFEVDGTGTEASGTDEGEGGEAAMADTPTEGTEATSGTEAAGDAVGSPAVRAGADGVVDDAHVFAPPRVRQLARELGVDLARVANAVGGPISENDVRRAAGESGGEPTPEPVEAGEPEQEDGDSPASEGDKQERATGTRQRAAVTRSGQTGSADREKTLAAPATRQFAREEGIDIDAVPTENERDGVPFVTPEDVEAFADAGTVPEATGHEASGGARPSGVRTEKRIPYQGIRKVIGDNMAEAKYTAPHVSHHDSTEIEDLVEIRETFKERIGGDVSLTYLPFVIKAVVKALKEHPYMNASLDQEAGEISLKEYYDIGIATATDRGLVVPVLRDADGKGILELAQEIDDLIIRARNGDLSPDEMRASTFTITNFGAIGGDHATPIINYPEAAILGLGAIEERPVVEDGDVVARHTLPLSLSVDHRLIDGAVAAQFTNDVKTYLHTPEMLLL